GAAGGSAALVAARGCERAVGADAGGSVRIRAAYCGITGLKPTYGLLPLEGVFPLSPTCDHVGTLTATVSGSGELLAVLAGPAARADPGAAAGSGARADHAIELTVPPGAPAFTVGVLSTQLTDPSVTAEVHAGVSFALAVLSAAGWHLREITAPWLEQLAQWEDTLAVIVAAEAFKVHQGRVWDRYAEGTRALLGFGASVSAQQYANALRHRAELTAAIEACLTGVDVLAGPTVG